MCVLIRYFIVCSILPFVVPQVKFYFCFNVQYIFVLYVSLCVCLGWILNRFRFRLFRSYLLSLFVQVSL